MSMVRWNSFARVIILPKKTEIVIKKKGNMINFICILDKWVSVGFCCTSQVQENKSDIENVMQSQASAFRSIIHDLGFWIKAIP